MTAQSHLEITGTLEAHPFAELTAEIAQYGLDGSLRLDQGAVKIIVYFRQGKIVFAVSNQRSSRIFDILMRRGRLTSDDLLKIPEFTNDQACAGYLIENGFLDKAESTELFTEQIRSIIVDALSSNGGTWTFSSLARARDGLAFDIDERKMLADLARCLTPAMTVERFRSADECFARAESANGLALSPNEERVLAQLSLEPAPASSIVAATDLDQTPAYHALYALWLTGLALRYNWRSAFSEYQASAMRKAKLELRREAVAPTIKTLAEQRQTAIKETPKTVEPEPAPEAVITIDEYLTRVESAKTYYDVLGVAHTSDLATIKKAYFSLAKMFHPDHYHKAGVATMKRVQSAFTELSAAHENLRTAESREVYDYKVRKELADKAKLGVTNFDEESRKRQQAGDEFERGFSLLMDGKIDAATPFLARAAHFDPRNPRYRAYYGKALAHDDKQRHKAEGEMQAAIKIDPSNATYRLMLAEFFVQVRLLKRAEGELNRLLAAFPNNREARDLLATLK